MKSLPPVRILMVEDSEAEVLLLKETFADLEGFGHKLFHVERLSEALGLLRKENFDVVLLDLGLPDSQGLDTFTKLHQDVPGVPVLVLTALNDEAVGVKAMKLGAQDYLIKNQMEPLLLTRAIRYAIERQRINAEMSISQQQLRALAARLQDVREAERTHIAREVHDELGQLLTALKMDLRWVEKHLADTARAKGIDELRSKIVEAQKLADRTIGTVQRISLELRPSVLDNLGLIEAIRDEGRRFEVRTGVNLKLELPGTLPRLKPEAVNAFFRILQELLTNVARHSAARNAEVQLSQGQDELELVVQDDGKGMPASALTQRTSLGLLGMSERAISLAGQIHFEGVPGQGTRATLRIPITAT